ncbi:branched-chain amino acid aminotransferase [Desulfobulbus sp. AH-315-M07]|nr:branched-chain amino acid aminotransferase [Desulfobulbus sp. AH-315-M07]
MQSDIVRPDAALPDAGRPSTGGPVSPERASCPREVRRARPDLTSSKTALGFGKYFSDHVFRMQYRNGRWDEARIEPYSAMALEPGAASLHYAQSIFEGFKAFRGRGDAIRVFRPDQHAARFERSAKRLCIPAVPTECFLEGCEELIKLDSDWVPSADGASLYIRPLVFAAEPFLGVRPAETYEFIVMTSPVDAYYAEGFAPVRILVEREQVRAAPGGLGDVKTAANYAASLQAGLKAKKAGYAQVLWTDAIEHRWVEEVGTMNVFFALQDEIVTPPLHGTILPGITRASVIELLRRRGENVVERPISLDEIRAAHTRGQLREAFGTGTAAVVSPIAALGFSSEGSDIEDLTIGDGNVGPIAESLFAEIQSIQRGETDDVLGWMRTL